MLKRTVFAVAVLSLLPVCGQGGDEKASGDFRAFLADVRDSAEANGITVPEDSDAIADGESACAGAKRVGGVAAYNDEVAARTAEEYGVGEAGISRVVYLATITGSAFKLLCPEFKDELDLLNERN